MAAVARDAGIPVDRVAEGSEVPEDAAALRAFVEATSVVGRISPEGKRRVVLELHRAGHHVAMVGDGVNDVPALKAADLAIAQGPGAQIAKSVADLVLVRGDFAAVPALVEAGRQALRNLQRVARAVRDEVGAGGVPDPADRDHARRPTLCSRATSRSPAR